MYYVYQAENIYYSAVMWMEDVGEVRGCSLDITMSHYSQMQRDLKGASSFIKGGGRQQKEKKRQQDGKINQNGGYM